MTEKQEEICECGFYKKFHKQIFRDVVELTDLPKSPCKKFKPKNHSPQGNGIRHGDEQGTGGTQNQEGCGKEACGVQTIDRYGEQDVDITECGVMCPYHKEVHYCKECQEKEK